MTLVPFPQGFPSDVQDYVTCLTFDPALCVNSSDPDDVQYSSLQLKSSTAEEVPLYSTVQKPKLSKQHQEATEYAAVNVSKLSPANQWVEW